MQYGLYVSAAGALAHSYRQDVVANNLANADTVSFKRDLAILRACSTESEAGGGRRYSSNLLEGLGGGVFGLPTHTDFSPAALDKTDGPFDLALAGEGFFQVLRGGERCFTRDGRFTLNAENQLVTRSGELPVLDASGQPIVVNPSLDFSVNESGQIHQAGSQVAQLAVVDFEDTTVLRKHGGNLYELAGAATPQAVSTPVKQGALEGSGVVAVKELTELIQAQRMFQMNLSTLQLQDQTLGLAVTRLGSVT